MEKRAFYWALVISVFIGVAIGILSLPRYGVYIGSAFISLVFYSVVLAKEKVRWIFLYCLAVPALFSFLVLCNTGNFNLLAKEIPYL